MRESGLATLGDRACIIEDLIRAYTLNPNWTPTGKELERLNVPPVNSMLSSCLRHLANAARLFRAVSFCNGEMKGK